LNFKFFKTKAQDSEVYPIVLCGNKSDLMERRQVSKTTAEEYTSSLNWPYFETSAKTRENVEESFTELVKFIAKYKKAVQDSKNNSKTESKTETKKTEKSGGIFGFLKKKK
jgi:GTPase SAR1 family protein